MPYCFAEPAKAKYAGATEDFIKGFGPFLFSD